MSATANEWLTHMATELGTEPPSAEEVDQLLELASVAAHASERLAAPLSCWLAARAGCSPGEALVTAHAIAQRLAASDPVADN